MNKGDYDGKFSNKIMANVTRYINSQQSGQSVGQVYENRSYNNDDFRYGFNTVQLNEYEGIVVTGHFSASGKDIWRGASIACDYVGTTASTVGYGLLLSGVGTGLGASLSSFGTSMSDVSAICNLAIDVGEQNLSSFLKDAAWTILDKALNIHLRNVLPGGNAKFGNDKFNLGTEIVKDGFSLKFNYLHKALDAASDQQPEEEEKEHK